MRLIDKFKKTIRMKPKKNISELSGIITIFLVAVLAGQLYLFVPSGAISLERIVGIIIVVALLYLIVLFGQVGRKIKW